MLTSPLNVTIVNSAGAGLKAQATATDIGAGHSPVPPADANPAPELPVIEPELPSQSALTTVSAGTATAASRTVLQDLSLNVANLLKVSRGTEENLTALFIRIIAAIERMSQAERLQFEVHSGLKALKITLTDLAGALKNPDGAEAARLTAMAEAPLATPGKTAANAATTTYLQQGTVNGHTEETLAMRAAARNNAAGLGLFSAEARPRIEPPQADAKGLQDQLKTLFEPGLTERGTAAAKPEASAAKPVVSAFKPADPAPESQDFEPGLEAPARKPATSETKLAGAETNRLNSESRQAGTTAKVDAEAIRGASLKVDPQLAEKLRDVAQEIRRAEEPQKALAEAKAVPDTKTVDKAEAGDRRLQTMLTLRGFAEVMTALPGKAAGLFAALPDTNVGEADVMPNPANLKAPMDIPARGQAVAISTPDVEQVPEETTAAAHAGTDIPAPETRDEEATLAAPRKAVAQPEAEARAIAAEAATGTRAATPQQGVPFAYALPQMAREEFVPDIEEADARDNRDEEDAPQEDEDGEPRRPRDEYDEMRDPQPEEQPAIVLTRDSTEADRAFALYQRMGGF